jgi:hypothetical protein
MNGCPIYCPCRWGGKGAGLLALCAFAALHARVLLGADFGALVTGLVNPPHDLPLALAVWAVVAAVGGVMLVIGLRALLREGDSPAAKSAVAMIAAAATALWCGWYPAWGAVWSLAAEGFYDAIIAASAANLILALGAQVWMAGHVAAGGDHVRPRAVPFDPDKWRLLLEKQAKDIARLTADCTQTAGHARQLETVLRFPPVKKAVLKVLHPDSHAGAGEHERRALTQQFQTAAAVFEILEQTGH